MNILNKNKEKFIVAFCIKQGITYRFEKMINIKANTRLVKYDDNNVFVIDIENPTYSIGNNQFFCIDINSRLIHMIPSEEGKIEVKNGNVKLEELQKNQYISSRITKLIFLDSVIEQLSNSVMKPVKQTYDYKAIVIGLIIGGLIGIIIGLFIPFGVM